MGFREDVKDFHCCLEIQEVAEKTVAIGFEPEMDVTEHILVFHPPITFQNLLPNNVTVKILSSTFVSSVACIELLIATGESLSIYEVDFNKFLGIKLEMLGCSSNQACEVLSPAKYLRCRLLFIATRFTKLLISSVVGSFQTVNSQLLFAGRKTLVQQQVIFFL